MTILNSAYDSKDQEGTGEHEPMTWVIPFGKGKVVTTVMGHHMGDAPEVPSLQCVGFKTIVARAAEWVATGKVTVPMPAEFPQRREILAGSAHCARVMADDFCEAGETSESSPMTHRRERSRP